MREWFVFDGAFKFVSLDPVNMKKSDVPLECDTTGVPSISDQAALAEELIVTDADVILNNPYIDEIGSE